MGSLQFSVPKDTSQGTITSTNLYFSTPKRATQENARGTNFSSKNTTLENEKLVAPIKMNLSKNDLLYSLLSATPKDLGQESFKGTVFSSKDTTLESEKLVAPIRVLSWSEKQKKIKLIKEESENLKKENLIADQIRNEDVDTQLITDLANLEKDIPVKEHELLQMMKDELKHKIRLLDAETALKVAEIKMLSSTRSYNVVARLEDRVLSETSGARKELIRKMFIREPENYYQLKEQGKQLEAVYQVDIAQVKLQYQQKINVVKNDIESLRVANKKIIDNRFSELEVQRIAEALIIEERVKAKNQEIVNQSHPGLKAKISKYIDAFEIKLSQREAFILGRLKEEYVSKKSSRNSTRELENRRYIAGINQQIEQEQITYKDQSRDRLYSARDAKVDSIIKGQKRSINQVESDGAQKLATLEAQHARGYEKQKHTLQAPYKKKEQLLNQKSRQVRSKVLSRFNSENYAIIAKEKKEIDLINREINARVKAEIKVLLGSFEALKKEEAAIAKKISLEKPKESPGFFESLF